MNYENMQPGNYFPSRTLIRALQIQVGGFVASGATLVIGVAKGNSVIETVAGVPLIIFGAKLALTFFKLENERRAAEKLAGPSQGYGW